MKRSRFSEEQIVKIIREGAAGVPVDDLTRQYGISRATYYSLRSKYGGMEISEVKRLKELERENSRLKQLLGEAQLDIRGLKDIVSKKW